jgi:hypothetical protein
VPEGEVFGEIVYDETTKKVTIDATGDIAELEKYLTTVKRFKIPESQTMDDFRIDKAKPTKNKDYFTQALCSCYAHTGFWILWDTLEV